MNTLTIAIFAVTCIAFLLIGLWLGRILSRSSANESTTQLQTEWTNEKQSLEKEQQRLSQELALLQQEKTQLQAHYADEKQSHLDKQQQSEKLQASLSQTNAQLSASQSNESGLTTRLNERQQQLEQLNIQLNDAGRKVAVQQDLIESQKLDLGQAHAEKEQLRQLQLTLQAKDTKINQLNDELNLTSSKIQALQTASHKDAENMAEKLALLENNKITLKQEFENLANSIFENKQQHFQQQSKQGLDTLLQPFKEQLESFRKRVDEVHTNNVEGHTSMKVELEKLRDLNQNITAEAANLTRALKGDKKLQGIWGEQKVDLLLEQSGLRVGIEYLKEANYKDDDNNNQRPDFIINLPEQKHIIVDSKMSLVAYAQYVGAETDIERQVALNAHLKSVRDHINTLSQRYYHKLKQLNSPDFVFMFMGIEPAYLLAAERDPSLFQEAYEKGIAIVTATTLLPVLRVVANLWVIQRQNQTTRELADQASHVYNKLRIFVDKMEDLGRHIDKAQISYKESFNTLKDGHGSLTKTVHKFIDLGVKVTKQLPASVLIEDLPALSDNTIVSLPNP